MDAANYFVPQGDPEPSYRVTADELRQIIEYWEYQQARKEEYSELQKEILAQAKERGYAVAAIKKVIARRKRDRGDLAVEEAVIAMYEEALGM